MKRLILSAIIATSMFNAFAHDFTAVAPTGQTLYYSVTGNNTVAVVECSYMTASTPGALTIPSTVTNGGTTYTVTSIDGAFDGHSSLTSVIIPSTVVSIGDYSFRQTGITAVDMGNGVTSIGQSAFSRCSNLSSIIWSPSLLSIGVNSFYRCDALTTVVLPNSVTTIGDEAFFWCGNLSYVSVGTSITLIGNSAFRQCTNLNTISFPHTLTSIGNHSFRDCRNLTVVSIPNAVTSIGTMAFHGCTNIHKVTLGSALSSIGTDAFRNCYNLDTIISKSTIPPTMEYYTFGAPDTGIVLMVPCGSTTTYQNNAQWSVFTNMQEVFPFDVIVVSNDTTKGSASVITYPTCTNNQTCVIEAIANNGYHFAQWSDGNTQNPRTIAVSDDISLEAYFYEYIISATSSNVSWGTVSGGGYYFNGDIAVLTAIPSTGYQFDHWQDGNTDNPRMVTVVSDSVFTAFFEQDANCPPIAAFPWINTFDESLSCWENVDADNDGYSWTYYQGYALSESWSYFDGSNHALSPDNWLISREIQMPSNGTYSLYWSAKSMVDQGYFNEHYSLYVSTTGNAPSNFTTQLFSETLNSNNNVNRSVSLQSYRDQTIRIAFRHHDCSDQFVLAIANVRIAQGTQGIDEINTNDVNIYAVGGQIVVETEQKNEIGIYDIVGRKVDGGRKNRFEIPASGVYLVKMGSLPPQKVVVVK